MGWFARLSAVRAVRHIAVTSGLVLAVCLAVAALSTWSYVDVDRQLSTMSGRATGEVVRADERGGTVAVDWREPSGAQRSAEVAVDGSTPKPGAQTEIAYDPSDPRQAIIPGATLLTQRERAASGIAYPIVVVVLVALVDGYLLARRFPAGSRSWTPVHVRRVRLQRGLMARSWLEFEDHPQAWVPVYFDAGLLELPAPATVEALGDPRSGRAAFRRDADTPPQQWFYPAGGIRATEPLGRRLDNAARPDRHASVVAAGVSTMRRQLRVDSVLLIPAPFVGLFWAFLDGSGFPGWSAATAVAGAAALWYAAVRGSDPS